MGQPSHFHRRGLVLCGQDGGWGGFVIGDPCVVRDDDEGSWRMFLFALPPGHGQAICHGDPLDPTAWRFEGPLAFTNAEILGSTAVFKPFVILDAASPGKAACLDGRYALLLGADADAKVVWRAWSTRLAGPWTIEPGPLIERGRGSDFDAKHVDAVSAWLLRDRDEILYFYMGYPACAQPHALSPLGSSQGAAVEPRDVAAARGKATTGDDRNATMPPPALRKLGRVLAPSQTPGHWASGWVGGLQLLCRQDGRWLALVNASPTPPCEDDTSISHEEPPPSLGGFAFCDEAFPVTGWKWSDAPIEWTGDVPEDARSAGEIVNFWRHYALVLDDGRIGLFYNAGDYFQEKLFLRVALPVSGASD